MKDIFINMHKKFVCGVLGNIRHHDKINEVLKDMEQNKSTVQKEIQTGLKDIKYCKYCGSNNIIKTTGYYSHYNCLECKTENID